MPGARDLLSLLSILPDGLSDIELIRCNLPIPDILGARAALLGTSLAYMDAKKRLKSLVPIREHIRYFYPPPTSLVHPLRSHFHVLLDLYGTYPGFHQMSGRVDEIKSNTENLEQVLLLGLNLDDCLETIHCILSFNSFRRVTGQGRTTLMDHIPAVLRQLCNPGVEIAFMTELFQNGISDPIPDPEVLVHQAISHFQTFQDPVLECKSTTLYLKTFFSLG
jgi:hypothetical protein